MTTTAVAIRDPTITALEAYPMSLEEARKQFYCVSGCVNSASWLHLPTLRSWSWGPTKEV